MSDARLPLTVRTIFDAANLRVHGPVQWKQPLLESSPGVYVIASVVSPDAEGESLDVQSVLLPEYQREHARWLPSQPVIYIGRSRRPLRRRLSEFYSHQYGQPSPHGGGQALTVLSCPLWVYWSPTMDWALAEHAMIERFRTKVGSLPFANRMRSARVRQGDDL